MKCTLFLLSSILLIGILNSQERKDLSFINYSTKQGLSSNEVTVITQDDLGFIWVGTEDGLNRFDGYNFKVYRKNPNDSTSLSNNNITALFTDSNGNLWIGAQKGLNLYNRDGDSFVSYYPFDNDHSSQSNFVSSITQNKNDVVFISLQHGVYKYDSLTESFVEKMHSKPEIRFIYFDSDNLLWVLTDSNIKVYDEDLHLIKTIINPQVDYPYRCIVEDGDKYWIGTIGNGFFWYDKIKGQFSRSFQINIYEDYINTIYKDRENNIWIGSVSSLKLYDRNNDKFHYYYANEDDKNSLTASALWAFLHDQEGNYWALTAKGGLDVSLVKKEFENFTPGKGSSIPLTKRYISSLMIDSNNDVWAGAYNEGIDILNTKDYYLRHIEHDPKNKNSLAQNSILSLFEDSKNNIWVGAYRGGLQKYDKSTGDFITYKPDPNNQYSIGGDDIRAIAEDKEGNLWLAMAGSGLDKFDVDNNKFYHFRQNPNSTEYGLVNDWLYSLLFDSEGYLWVGSAFGLSRINTSNETFTNFYNDPNDSTSISNNTINFIIEDSNFNLWFCTNEGLSLFNKKTETFTSYLKKDGLPNSVIRGILEDDQGYLWLSTNNGISKFNPRDETFVNYDVHDGLPSDEFSSGACAKDKYGKLFFGSNYGIVSFYPEKIKPTLAAPKVFITDLKLYNKSISVGGDNSPLNKNILQTQELVLPHKKSGVISFEFVAISYIQSERKQYAYKMDGFDKDWIYTGNKRAVTYTNLDPGKYTFRVKASNHDNIWNEEGASLTITIQPAWWQTTGFRAILVLLFICLVVSYTMLRTRTLKRQKHKLEQLVKLRTHKVEEQNETLKALNATKDKFFTIIAHDLKNPFNSILGFSEILSDGYFEFDDKQKLQYIKTIRNSSETVYKLLQNLLQWARSQTGALKFEPNNFNLKGVFDYNIELLKHHFEEKDVRLTVDIADNLSVYADKNMIDTVIRNLLTNAIKFIEKGEISISADLSGSGDQVEISIQDTGIGIGEEEQKDIFNIVGAESKNGTRGETGTGLGLIICKEFINKNNGLISLKSELGKGTTFTIFLPTSKT